MRVTLQEIADRAGVSRGTVDRALHGRGRVNPEKAERILKLAEEMGYHRNRSGRALALIQTPIRIGMIALGSETPFIQRLLEGAREEAAEAESFGAEVLLKSLSHQSVEELIGAMRELRKAGCKGIALMPAEDARVAEEIHRLEEEGVSVVTFNTDLPDSGREYFVGENALQSGRTAGGLMAEILPENADVLVLSGYPSNRAHHDRTEGFTKELRDERADVGSVEIYYNYDGEEISRKTVLERVDANPSIRGIYLASAGLSGVCEAVRESRMEGQIKVISNDVTEENIRLLKNGAVRFLIGNDARQQGSEPIRVLLSILLDGVRPKTEKCYSETAIYTKNNIS
jgi:LacI family transcriptional regulator